MSRRAVAALLLACCLGAQTPPAGDPVAAATAALATAEREHGAEALETATAAQALSLALFRVGRVDEAKARAERVLAIRRQRLAAGDLLLAEPLQVLGAVAGRAGQSAAAAAAYEEALAIRSRHEAKDAPYVQMLRMNLAFSRRDLQDYLGAWELAAAGREIAIGKQGADSLAVANFESVLGLAGESMGRYRESAEYLAHAAQVFERKHGEGHPDTLRMQAYLGLVTCRLGRAEEGLAAMGKALARLRAVPGAAGDEIDWLTCVRAELRGLCLDVPDAEADLRAALAVARQGRMTPGAASFHVLQLTSLLAGEACRDEDLEVARAALQQCERHNGTEDLVVAAALANVAYLHVRRKEAAAARPLFERSLAILDRSPWLEVKDRQKVVTGLGGCLYMAGDRGGAATQFERCLAQLPTWIDLWLPALSEPERLELVADTRRAVDLLLSAAPGAPAFDAARQWQAVLQWKGQVARGLLQQRQWLREHGDATSLELRQRLAAATGLLAARRQAAAPAAELAELESRRAACEHELSARLGARGVATPAPAAIVEALRDDEVLLDFVGYVDVPPNLDLTSPGERLVVFAAVRGEPVRRIDLGPLPPIREALAAHLQVVARWRTPARGGARAENGAGAELAALLWQPLRQVVGARRRVYICPDGEIALLPFATLPDAAPGSFLLERHEFVSLQTSQDVLQPSLPAHSPGLCLVGDVDYGAPAPAPGPVESRVAATPGRFAALPETAAEIDAVAALFRERAGDEKLAVLRGAQATAAAFRDAVKDCGTVHVATHGFYAGTRELPPLARRFGYSERRGAAWAGNDRPGLQSGVAFAGANAGAGAVLVADELAWLDLAHCDLVVLSACETGVGAVSSGDGLLGVRRALRLAGARCSLTTAWRVDDRATRALMAAFHRHRWLEGATPASALRAAQLEALAAARREHGEPLPGLWGAFLLEGR